MKPTNEADTTEAEPAKVRCPRCFAADIVHSMPDGMIDDLMKGWGRVPKHCRCCGKRFYVRVDPPVK